MKEKKQLIVAAFDRRINEKWEEVDRGMRKVADYSTFFTQYSDVVYKAQRVALCMTEHKDCMATMEPDEIPDYLKHGLKTCIKHLQQAKPYGSTTSRMHNLAEQLDFEAWQEITAFFESICKGYLDYKIMEHEN